MLIPCTGTLLRLLVLFLLLHLLLLLLLPCCCVPLLVFVWIAKDCTVFVSATANEPTNKRLRLCYSERTNEATTSSLLQRTNQRTNVFVSATANEPTNQRLRRCYSERTNEPTSSSLLQRTNQRTNVVVSATADDPTNQCYLVYTKGLYINFESRFHRLGSVAQW